VDAEELDAGLWNWTDGVGERDVCRVYCEGDDRVCLFDPVVPPEDAVRFLRALDSDHEPLRRGGDVLSRSSRPAAMPTDALRAPVEAR
jgi:hypothetical protein